MAVCLETWLPVTFWAHHAGVFDQFLIDPADYALRPLSRRFGSNTPFPVSGKMIEFWFEEKLTPLLPPGTVAIMDNAQFHRKGILREIASRHGVMVLFLPPYSPEFNPIEHLWANIKKWLKKNIRNYDSFEDALEAALDVYS